MASLITYPRFKAWLPATGTPLASGTLSFFAAGTSTPLAAYTDSGLTTPAANPFTLDANGEGTFYAGAGVLYKLVLKDSVGATIWTVDNVTIAGGSASSAASGAEWVASGLTPTFISATSYSFVGDQTGIVHVGRRQKSTVTAGTIYSTVTVAAFAAGITTVTVANDSGVLDSGLSVVSFGILDSANTSLPGNAQTAVAVHFGNGSALTTAVGVLLGASASTGVIDTDVLTEFSATTGLFTAKRPGRYLIGVQWAPTPTGVTYSGFSGLTIEKNAGTITSSTAYLVLPAAPLATNNPSAQSTMIVNLAAGDTLGVRGTVTFSAGSYTYGGGLINIGRIA